MSVTKRMVPTRQTGAPCAPRSLASTSQHRHRDSTLAYETCDTPSASIVSAYILRRADCGQPSSVPLQHITATGEVRRSRIRRHGRQRQARGFNHRWTRYIKYKPGHMQTLQLMPFRLCRPFPRASHPQEPPSLRSATYRQASSRTRISSPRI